MSQTARILGFLFGANQWLTPNFFSLLMMQQRATFTPPRNSVLDLLSCFLVGFFCVLVGEEDERMLGNVGLRSERAAKSSESLALGRSLTSVTSVTSPDNYIS